jgi:16S rRNA C967 or C1407 C5-methylase (RsmB/RsmF family)
MILISNKRGDLDTLGKAIVYVTFSKNKSENEEIVHTAINEQNEQRSQQAQRKDLASYK